MSVYVCTAFEALEDLSSRKGDKIVHKVIRGWHDRYHIALETLVVDDEVIEGLVEDEMTLMLTALKKIVMEVESHAAS